MSVLKSNVSKCIKSIKIHMLSDLGLPLSEEVNKTIQIEINYLLRALDDLVESSSVIISKTDKKMLIANNGSKMLVLLLKESDMTWSDIMLYRFTSYFYRV
jgi:hypothetical protein